MLLERKPLAVGPLPPVATGLLGELGPVGAGVHRYRLPRAGSIHNARVDGDRVRHFVSR